ncbi:hypothetical protein IVA95_23450 [Bradyrhizobium sp. 157]|uniref:hypothetical protein n=1 Tax=Bradyrhizobium sp. 157 TaxID=2782631 RepID=UPI001FF91F52|nr:hypothetical protein [Bradyrhizobium sp. 157]MCK1640458.1 hypothetical protein [Bradyrhizobium sp. 157]
MNGFTNLSEINRRAINKERQLLRLIRESEDDEREAEMGVTITPPNVDPFDFDEAGGLLGTCARWVLNNARSPLPELALFAAIIFLASVFGLRAVGPTGLGANLYLVMVAPTGSGKDWPLKAPRVLLQSLGAFGKAKVGPTNVTGDSAIERALQASPCFYMAMDEFGLLLQGATNPKAPAWTQTICRALLELYSRSDAYGSWKAKSTAAKVKGVKETPVEQPTVLILGATTPDEFYKGLTAASTSNGLLNRLVVIAMSGRKCRMSRPSPRCQKS